MSADRLSLTKTEYARAIDWRNRYADRGVYRERLCGGQYAEARELPLIEHGFSRRDLSWRRWVREQGTKEEWSN